MSVRIVYMPRSRERTTRDVIVVLLIRAQTTFSCGCAMSARSSQPSTASAQSEDDDGPGGPPPRPPAGPRGRGARRRPFVVVVVRKGGPAALVSRCEIEEDADAGGDC